MADNVLESYLVKLGATVDASAFTKFDAVLKRSENSVVSSTSGMVKEFAKLEFGIVGAFSAVGLGLLSMADKTAMADQNYRLLGMRMLMSKDQARSMQMALDTLGVTIDDLVDPELNQRFQNLMDRYQKLGQTLGPGFNQDMKSIRLLRDEYKMFGSELEFLTMGAISRLFERLGYGSGDLLTTVRKLNDEFATNMPMWADKASEILVPAWQGFLHVMGGVKDSAEQVGLNFTNIIGILSGDKSIQGTTFDLEKMGTALDHVAVALVKVSDVATKTLGAAANFVGAGASLVAQATLTPYIREARMGAKHARARGDEQTAQMFDAKADALQNEKDRLWNQYLQQHADSAQKLLSTEVAKPPNQAYTDFMKGQGMSPVIDASKIQIPASMLGPTGGAASSTVSGGMAKWISDAAKTYNIDPNMLTAIMLKESSGNPNAVNPESGATGLGQFMTGTAKKYGLTDRTNPQQNLLAMAHYLSDLQVSTGGDIAKELTQYGGFRTKDPSQYIGDVLGNYSKLGGGTVTIENQTIVIPPHMTAEQGKEMVREAMREALASRDRRTMAQTAGGPH